MNNITDKATAENGAESAAYEGIIIDPDRRQWFFDYLGMKLKLPKIIMEETTLTAIIAFILVMGLPTAIVSGPVTAGVLGSALMFLGITMPVFSLVAFTPIILIAAGVFVAGTVVVAKRNSPKLSFKTALNVIVEEMTKYLFLPALVLIKQNASNFSKTENDLVKVLKKQMTDIGYTEGYVRVFFERYENKTVKELENVLSTLNTSSDKLLKKMPGQKIYSSDFKSKLYVDKAIELCEKINGKYCDEVAKQNENKETIIRLKALLSADEPTLMKKTRDKINAAQKAFVDKHVLNKQDADSYATALFVEPFIWFLRSPNMQPYFEQIFERKLANLGYSESSIKELLATYSAKTPDTIFETVKEKYEFAHAHGIKTDVLIEQVRYHCKKECYIYVPTVKRTKQEQLLKKLEDAMNGTSAR